MKPWQYSRATGGIEQNDAEQIRQAWATDPIGRSADPNQNLVF